MGLVASRPAEIKIWKILLFGANLVERCNIKRYDGVEHIVIFWETYNYDDHGSIAGSSSVADNEKL